MRGRPTAGQLDQPSHLALHAVHVELGSAGSCLRGAARLRGMAPLPRVPLPAMLLPLPLPQPRALSAGGPKRAAAEAPLGTRVLHNDTQCLSIWVSGQGFRVQ